jgi:hypothetical protein
MYCHFQTKYDYLFSHFRAGITYVSVHDCYWTHPCDVDVMNKVCREQFVHLHEQSILENLSDSMIVNYAIPERYAPDFQLFKYVSFN